MKKVLALAAAVLTLPAHAEMIIDGSSEATFKQSIEEMLNSYASSEMKEAFSEALLQKLMDTDPLTANLSGFDRLAGVLQATETMHVTLDGVSQSEIERTILSSIDTKTTSSDKDKQVANEKHCDLDQHVAVLIKDIELIDLMGPTAKVTVSVTNTGPFAISGFAVSYALSTDGRTVPWETDDYYFNEVSGGIEPNETIADTIFVHDLYDDRVSQPLSIELEVVDVRDYEGRFLRDPNVNLLDYPNELTRLDCFETN
ncbi:hypothetical protein [Thalassobacter stenotrophicus]|uniref:CARDB domain-containing protein n=2 Tax=Thalassobacter stenotrophicus TaxID=266809 RepID=A0A0P1FGS5_9RHOB|nr:hypothetical protein [Thalassobacter stenotrophicus]CUH60253.1 hypothetical protein THS5294_01542 [Thalassobacter stenotrophicus]SHI71257.1 hypothetical protein SAMN02744035_01333 [Thalassobacter stenotrophicus DSM 16310]